jgi:predicted metal-dependent phosphoesterase TrpH
MHQLDNNKYTKKAELHCHDKSNFLPYVPLVYDSVLTINEIVSTTINRGIRVLSITSHDSLQGYHLAEEILKKMNSDLLLIPGSEISTKRGHILAYGIEREIKPNLSPEETIERIHDQGGIAVAAHPYLTFFGLGDTARALSFDAIEGLNASIPIFPKIANNKAIKLAKDSHLPFIAGSDAHDVMTIGNGCLLFKDNVKTRKDVILAIKNNDFVIEFKQTEILRMIFTHLKKNAIILLRGL